MPLASFRPAALALLSLLAASPVMAAAMAADIGYRLQCPTEKTGPLVCQVLGPDGGTVASVENPFPTHYHPLQVVDGTLYWIRRPGSFEPGWADELVAQDLNAAQTTAPDASPQDAGAAETRQPESKRHETAPRVVARGQKLDFRITGDGSRAAVVAQDPGHRRADEGWGLDLVELRGSGHKRVFTGGVALLGFSTDGRQLWFGRQEGGGPWTRLGLFQGGKVRWFEMGADHGEIALEFDRGWVARSNAPLCGDAACIKGYQKKNEMNRLVVTDLFTGRREVVAEGRGSIYRPAWQDGRLTFRKDGKRATVEPFHN
jgi:stalled ribosome alternative rescue factor ArfA